MRKKQRKGKRIQTGRMMVITHAEMQEVSQAPTYYAVMLLMLPPTPEREEALDMLEAVEQRLIALTLQEKKQPENILFVLSPQELYALYHAILGYLALDAPGTNKKVLHSFIERMKPFLPFN